MPAPHPQEARRGKLLQGLFWGGVGLAPLAILILLFGQSTGTLRVAVTLAVLTIVMLSVSIALRPSVEMVRVDIEHRVLDEMERMRLRSREDITTAARNTHRVLTEKIQGLAESVEELRAQVDEAGTMLAHPAPPAAQLGAPAAGPGVVRRTETVHVTRRTTTVDAGDDEARGTVYGSRAAVDGEWHERAGHRDEERERRWDGMAAGDRWASVRADDDGRELRLGERRSSVRNDGRGTEFHVEDRWAALRRDDAYRGGGDYGESDWEATFRSLSSRPAPALPASPGEPPERYVEDRRRYERERRDGEPVRSRGRERERYERDHARDDRGRDDRSRDDRLRDDRSRDDRSRDDRPRDDYRDERIHDRARDRDDDRDRDRDYDRDRDRDYDRDRDEYRGRERDDRGYERDRDEIRGRHQAYERERGYDRGRDGYERERGYEVPRPRSAHPSEYDR